MISVILGEGGSGGAVALASGHKITAQGLEKFRIVDGVVPEPMGGAHRDP